MNLYELMAQSAQKNPHKAAIIDSERKITYAELIAEIDSLARDLKSYGVQEKDKIGLMLPNSSAYIAISYAIWANDACIVPISTDLTPKEAQDIIRSTDLDAVITHKPL
jgi:acyl-CoA synthetase (AMP-forming)/AMP-acid ligase II